jgi:hypothetical protein
MLFLPLNTNLQVLVNKYKYQSQLISFLLIIITFSCNTVKYVSDDAFLLKNNKIQIIDKEGGVFASEFLRNGNYNEVIKQQPNRKILSKFRLHLWLYNLSNEDRIQKSIVKEDQKIVEINEKIKYKNKLKLAKDSSASLKPYKVRSLTFGERIREAGEPPVIISNQLRNKSSNQINVFLINNGFFENKVSDSLNIIDDRQAEVVYSIHTGKPSFLRNINFKFNDSVVGLYLDSIKSNSFLQKGGLFSTDNMDLERDRITTFLKNNGFFFFNKEFIYFSVDTIGLDHEIDVEMGIQNYKHKSISSDIVVERPHKQFLINNINVNINSDDKYVKDFISDTLKSNTINVINNQPIKYQKMILRNAISLKRNTYYNKKLAEDSYKRLSTLGLFSSVGITFDTISNTSLIDATVDLVSAKTQNITLSVDGTNNEGQFGIEGSMNYLHANLFHGGERFKLSLKGGLESQLLVTNNDESSLFNTIEFGPQLHVLIPKYFLINKNKKLKKHVNGRTEITAAVNFQKRPDFTRWNQELSFGWLFHEKKSKTWHINPIALSAINIDKTPEFSLQIDTLNDKLIAASFQDHIIAGGVYSYEFNSQKKSNFKNEFYFKSTFECGGGMLYQLHRLMNKPLNALNNSYDILGIRYAHFQKLFLDMRYYMPISAKSKLVYRLAGGMGVPRANLREALPFEKSFYSGGANGMRAWKARSLGPGSYYDSLQRFDKIGDIQIEGNLELRFPLSAWVEGALFVDMGNVWLLREDSIRSQGQFTKENFLNQIAVGSGLGLRLNLDFFIIRVDVAMPIKNPAVSIENNRWVFGKSNDDRQKYYPVQFNLGIGYPF